MSRSMLPSSLDIKLSSLMRGCSLAISTANETITNLMQYELSQEETDLLKAGLYNPTR